MSSNEGVNFDFIGEFPKGLEREIRCWGLQHFRDIRFVQACNKGDRINVAVCWTDDKPHEKPAGHFYSLMSDNGWGYKIVRADQPVDATKMQEDELLGAMRGYGGAVSLVA
jgi:hypothetical protein